MTSGNQKRRQRVSRGRIGLVMLIAGCVTPAPGQEIGQEIAREYGQQDAQRRDQQPAGEVTQESAQELPAPPPPIRAETGMIEADDPTAVAGPSSLTIADVVASVYRSYPRIEEARQQAQVARGQLVEAYGSYDTNLKAATISEPTGFYENYRHGIGVARQSWWGTNVYGGYRVGRGIFQPWYLERETEKGGEFKVGIQQPLLQGLAIDPQRFAVYRASLATRAADPILQQAILETSRDAIIAYWDWVAAGAALAAERALLELAVERGKQYQAGFEAGRFPEIDVVFNQQLIAERSAAVFDFDRKYQSAGIKLSLFLRDENGQPMIPGDDWLPTGFPPIAPLTDIQIDQEILMAIQRRPETRQLQIALRQLDLERRLAQNQRLPRFDFLIEGSQDVGQAGTSSDDKGEFVLVVGATSEVPVQRRAARGKLQATAAKIAQTNQKLRLQQDKIAVEIQTAITNLSLSEQVEDQAQLAVTAATQALDAFRFAFDAGNIDLIALNLLESKATETQLKLIEARQAWFIAYAQYLAATGVDPMEALAD